MGNPPALEAKSAGPSRERRSCRRRLRLDRLADGTKDGTDLAAKEDQGDDRDNRNESEDECVFGEALTFLVANEKRRDARVQTSHGLVTSFPDLCAYPGWVDPPGRRHATPLHRHSARVQSTPRHTARRSIIYIASAACGPGGDSAIRARRRTRCRARAASSGSARGARRCTRERRRTTPHGRGGPAPAAGR